MKPTCWPASSTLSLTVSQERFYIFRAMGGTTLYFNKIGASISQFSLTFWTPILFGQEFIVDNQLQSSVHILLCWTYSLEPHRRCLDPGY